MKELQELIEKLMPLKEKAEAESKLSHQKGNREEMYKYMWSAFAFSLAIEQAELLLKKAESKQPQPPDFANTMLGEVPHEVTAQSEDCSQAVEGATPVVRQNEQMHKVCFCGREIKYQPFGSQEWQCECGEVYKSKPADASAPDK